MFRWLIPSLKPKAPLVLPPDVPKIEPMSDEVILRVVSPQEFLDLAHAADVENPLDKTAFAQWNDEPSIRIVKTHGTIVLRSDKADGIIAHELGHLQKGHWHERR